MDTEKLLNSFLYPPISKLILFYAGPSFEAIVNHEELVEEFKFVTRKLYRAIDSMFTIKCNYESKRSLSEYMFGTPLKYQFPEQANKQIDSALHYRLCDRPFTMDNEAIWLPKYKYHHRRKRRNGQSYFVWYIGSGIYLLN